MSRRISPIRQTGSISLRTQGTSCGTLPGQDSVREARLPRPCLESGQPVSWVTAQMLRAQASQRRQPFPGLLAKDFPRARLCKSASNVSKTAILGTTASESSQDSATSPTSPARAPSMRPCRPRKPSKRLIAHLTTKDLSLLGIYQHCTVKVQRRTKHSTPASCTATLMPKKAVPVKTYTPIPALGRLRVRTGLLRHR